MTLPTTFPEKDFGNPQGQTLLQSPITARCPVSPQSTGLVLPFPVTAKVRTSTQSTQTNRSIVQRFPPRKQGSEENQEKLHDMIPFI